MNRRSCILKGWQLIFRLLLQLVAGESVGHGVGGQVALLAAPRPEHLDSHQRDGPSRISEFSSHLYTSRNPDSYRLERSIAFRATGTNHRSLIRWPHVWPVSIGVEYWHFCGASAIVHTWSFLCNIDLCKLFDWCILTREIRTRSNNQVLSIFRGFGKIVCLFLHVSRKLEKKMKNWMF